MTPITKAMPKKRIGSARACDWPSPAQLPQIPAPLDSGPIAPATNLVHWRYWEQRALLSNNPAMGSSKKSRGQAPSTPNHASPTRGHSFGFLRRWRDSPPHPPGGALSFAAHGYFMAPLSAPNRAVPTHLPPFPFHGFGQRWVKLLMRARCAPI
ncbi:hypothetical protein CI102_9986 [Trichoderma harzianum]|nr:hypothetical protein CI102_9986 [Trichoderma harzianum]